MRGLKTSDIYRLLAPFLAVMTLFFVVPLFLVVVYSFLTPGISGGVVWRFSSQAYIQLLFDRDFDGILSFTTRHVHIFLRSIGLAGFCAVLCLLIGFPTAYFMALRPRYQRSFWVLLVTVPFWTSLLVRTYAWLLILRNDGPINGILGKIGLLRDPLPLLYNDFSVALGLVYSYLPFMILPIYAALDRMNWSMVEAATDLYAGRWRVLRLIILPLAWPGIAAGCFLVFVPAMGSFLAPDLLGSGKEMMIGNLIQMQFGFSRNWPFGAALSVVLMTVVTPAVVYVIRRQNKAQFMPGGLAG